MRNDYRHRWISEAGREVRDRLRAEERAYRERHTAKYGEHVCTPDPADPWSTCSLLSAEAKA